MKEQLQRWRRRLLVSIIIFGILAGGLFMYRHTVLEAMGDRLIRQDRLKKCDVMFVLAGAPIERGAEAARLAKAGYATQIICTGGSNLEEFALYGMKLRECDVTKTCIVKSGHKSVKVLPEGTSTYEECRAILDYCTEHRIKAAMILSSKLHTRRIRQTLNLLNADATARFIVRGAPALKYHEAAWWRSEHGLIFVNNEYVKSFYYALKY